jgi:hypothetical protein
MALVKRIFLLHLSICLIITTSRTPCFMTSRMYFHCIVSKNFLIPRSIIQPPFFPYLFIILSHDRRKVLYFNITDSLSAKWTGQHIINAFPYETAPKYILRDKEWYIRFLTINSLYKSGFEFPQVIEKPKACCTVVPTSPE